MRSSRGRLALAGGAGHQGSEELNYRNGRLFQLRLLRYGHLVPVRVVPRTRLARLRQQRGVRPEEMAVACGFSLSTYRRLEAGRMTNPPLRYLANAAIALGVPLEDVVEDEWREWMIFDATSAPTPPRPGRFWRTSD